MPNLTDIRQSVAQSSVRTEALPLVLAPFREPPAPLWERILAHIAVYAICSTLVCLSWST